MILSALVLGALLATPARGGEPEEDWGQLHEALLYAADGDAEGAVRRLQRLAHELPGGDPLRPQVQYRLGQALLSMDDVDGARDALREGVRTGCPRSQCLALLGRIELAESAVRTVPTKWTFEDGIHGFLHPWRFADVGSIRVDRGGSEASLSWTTRVTVRSEDEIVVGFDNPSPRPRGIRFEIASLGLDAHVRLVLMDVRGRAFTWSDIPLMLPVGEVVKVDMRLDRVPPVPGEGRLLPSELERLVIQEVTAFYGDTQGTNQILLDEFEVY